MKRVILHLIPTLEGGGAERQLSMLACEQARRGAEVHVGVRRGGGIYEESLRMNGVELHILGDYRGINPFLLARINTLIQKIKPEVIQTWLPQMDIAGGLVALWNLVPWIVSERSAALAYQHQWLSSHIRGCIVRYANAIVANSSNGAAYWHKMLATDGNIFMVANAVDVESIRSAAAGVNKHINSRDSKNEFLVVGRLAPEKALEIIIESVCLVPEIYNIHVLIIGEGPLRQDIEIKIRQSGLGNRISLLPYQSSWWGLLQNTTALISMSRFEGHPNVVIETMAAKCPLIVSDISAHREFLDEESAILVQPDNPVSLSEAIVSLLSEPMAARQRAERAYLHVSGLTVQSAADAYESVYDKALIRMGT